MCNGVRWLVAALLIVSLSGCLDPELRDLVAQPRDMPDGYTYWPIDEAEFFRAITNNTDNPGPADVAAFVANGITPSAAHAAAYERPADGDDIVISVALAFASESAATEWLDEDLCESAWVLQSKALIAILFGFDAPGESTAPIVADAIQARTGAIDVCDPVKPWL